MVQTTDAVGLNGRQRHRHRGGSWLRWGPGGGSSGTAEQAQAPQVSELIDTEAVRDVFRRFARGIDRLDLDMVRACFHPGAIDEQAFPTGGIDHYLEMLASPSGHAAFMASTHFVGQQGVDLCGDSAMLESAVVAYRRDSATEHHHWVGLRYLDVLERRAGRWAITYRTRAWEWSQRAVPDGNEAPTGWPSAQRSAEDSLYRVRESIGSRTDSTRGPAS